MPYRHSWRPIGAPCQPPLRRSDSPMARGALPAYAFCARVRRAKRPDATEIDPEILEFRRLGRILLPVSNGIISESSRICAFPRCGYERVALVHSPPVGRRLCSLALHGHQPCAAPGSQILNWLPWPGWLSTARRPPWATTRSRAILNPKPIPWGNRLSRLLR